MRCSTSLSLLLAAAAAAVALRAPAVAADAATSTSGGGFAAAFDPNTGKWIGSASGQGPSSGRRRLADAAVSTSGPTGRAWSTDASGRTIYAGGRGVREEEREERTGATLGGFYVLGRPSLTTLHPPF